MNGSKLMAKVLALFLFIIQESHSQTLNMGYFVLPPHQMAASGPVPKPTGAAIAYFEIVAEKAGLKVTWTGLPLLRLTEYLNTGKIDGSVNYPKFKVFESMMYFCSAPMYFGKGIFIVKKDSAIETIRSIDDIKGLRIGVVHSKSDLYTPIIDRNRDKIILEKTPDLDWARQNLMYLMRGSVEALFDRQQYTLPYIAKTLHLDDQIKTIDAPEPERAFYIVFSKAVSRNPEVLRKINQVVLSPESPDYIKLMAKQFARVE